MAASRTLVTFCITSSTYSSAHDPSTQPPSIQRHMSSASNALAFQQVNLFFFGGRFSDSLFCNSLGYGTMITQFPGVRYPPVGITFEKAAADKREVYHRTGFTSDEGWLLHSLSSVRSSTENASKSTYPFFFVSLIPYSSAQTLKSRAMATGFRFLASSTTRSNILSKSS